MTRSLGVRAAVVAALVLVVAVAVAAVARNDDPSSGATEGPEAIEVSGTVPPYRRPFDPDEPLDLSGQPGVSEAEVAAAESLVADVAREAQAFASVSDAEAAGYRSIGDDFTGEEHFVRWPAVIDGEDLDPRAPEALVYDVDDDGGRTLAAVMFVRPPGSSLEEAPAPGGALTRWHRHGDLCLRADPADPAGSVIDGTTDAAGECPPGTEALRPMPTLHVWVVPHPCGPFAELEGVGTGLDRREELAGRCEHRHG